MQCLQDSRWGEMVTLSKPTHLGHRARMKEKYEKSGLHGWHDYEVLELVLSYAIARKDTKCIAKELLGKFKTLNGVLDADSKDLQSIGGVSKHSALFLKLLKDVSVFYMEKGLHDRDLLSSPHLVYDYLKTALKGATDEEFKILFLDNRNQLIGIETFGSGTINQTIVYPRKVVERALYNHAVGVIIAHNHPAGILKPSQDDCAVTKSIKDALKTVEISLLDHIIIGGNDYFSFNKKGLL